MPARGVSRAEKIRQDRRDTLRELLRHQKHEEHVLELLKKLEHLESELNSVEAQRISKAIDTRMKLIAKYLPDDREPQNINLGGQEDNPLQIQQIELVAPSLDDESEN